jgi:hypothetical protein
MHPAHLVSEKHGWLCWDPASSVHRIEGEKVVVRRPLRCEVGGSREHTA